ncbi:MAG: phenylalanine--tRNA ligase subunit beta, partial [Pseudomonadota bacterium]
HFGLLNPRTLKALDIDEPIALFEVFLDALPKPKAKSRTKQPLSSGDLMPVRRDFAFVVSAEVAAAAIIKAASSADKSLITNVDVFDLFVGGELKQAGRKSIGIEVTLHPTERTLTDADIDAISEKIVTAVNKATGGEIRS